MLITILEVEEDVTQSVEDKARERIIVSDSSTSRR
jgi:hypothetical protein